MSLHTRISGIPAIVKLTYFSKGYPAKINAEVDFCYEGEPDEIEYTVCDRRGRPAPWLAKKVTQADDERIINELRSH